MKRLNKPVMTALLLAMVLVAAGLPLAFAQGNGALVWQVGGQFNRPQGQGTFFWQNGSDDPVNLADVPDEGPGTMVFPCGANPVANNDDYMVTFVGGEMGGLYQLPLKGDSELVRFADAHALACSGSGMATFSPNGRRWAYISYPEAITRTNLYAVGELRVLDMPDGTEVTSFDDVVAFDLRDDALFYVQFFTNNDGEADEAVVTRWTDNGRREWAAVTPAEDCQWTSAGVDTSRNGRLVALSLGETCPNIGSQWRLFTFGEDGELNEHVYMPSGGRFQPHATDTQVFFLEDGNHVLATFPNGRAASIVNLVLVTLDEDTVTLVSEGVTVDTFEPNSRNTSMHMQLSEDGNTLAYASSTANDEHAIHRLALDGSYEPLSIAAGPRGDAISAFAFRPDGALVYVAGGVDGVNNSLYLLPGNADEPERVTRGQFLRDNIVTTNNDVLLLSFVDPDDDNREPAADLLRIGFNGSESTLVEGRASGSVAYPLWWR